MQLNKLCCMRLISLLFQMANVCWWFFFSKVIELLDTVGVSKKTQKSDNNFRNGSSHFFFNKKKQTLSSNKYVYKTFLGIFYPAQKVQPDIFSTCLPPLYNDNQLVAWR